jgi:hypothetical protein
MLWSDGDVVALRHLHAGRPSHVWPTVVVEDSRDLVALYLASGSPTLRRSNLDGSPLDRSLPYEERIGIPWRLATGAWFGSSCLQLQRVCEPRSWWRWLDGSGWYVNLQDRLRRTRIGFDTSDHVLDLVVAPDGSWRWKDEDEFEAACRVGRFTRKEAAAVRRAGEVAVAAIEARIWPFDSEWSEWQPNPNWTVPKLPADMSGL